MVKILVKLFLDYCLLYNVYMVCNITSALTLTVIFMTTYEKCEYLVFFSFSIKHLARDEFLMQVRTKLAILCYAQNSVLVNTQES